MNQLSIFDYQAPVSRAPSQLDAAASQRARDAGMHTATAHADRIEANWTDRAYTLLREFARISDDFLTEDLRDWAHRVKGFSTPPDGRAWGGVINRAVKAGLIFRIGFKPKKSKNCHGQPISVWRVAA